MSNKYSARNLYSDYEQLLNNFVDYEASKSEIEKVEDELFPEYNQDVIEIIEDRNAYREMLTNFLNLKI